MSTQSAPPLADPRATKVGKDGRAASGSSQTQAGDACVDLTPASLTTAMS
jgi:hypothetical protein